MTLALAPDRIAAEARRTVENFIMATWIRAEVGMILVNWGSVMECGPFSQENKAYLYPDISTGNALSSVKRLGN